MAIFIETVKINRNLVLEQLSKCYYFAIFLKPLLNSGKGKYHQMISSTAKGKLFLGKMKKRLALEKMLRELVKESEICPSKDGVKLERGAVIKETMQARDSN